MITEVRERVLEWFTGGESAFMLGAGCSFCAGKPLIGKLTTDVLAKTDPSIKEQFDGLKGLGSRQPTIEDLINYLLRYGEILDRLHDPSGHSLTPDWIEEALTAIKREIVTQIADDWVSCDHHALFLTRIRSLRPENPRDIFTINYDTVIEATLDSLSIPYSDGFRGSRYGWFDPTSFDEVKSPAGYFRLFKLHGSINWARTASGEIRRVVVNSGADAKDPVVVYPSEQKYLITQYGVYETLMTRFRERLRNQSSNNCLVVLGYSFNDEHINEAIIDAVRASGSNLTVIAFIGPESDQAAQKSRIEGIADRCEYRFNAFVGNDLQIGTALNETEGKEVLNQELWKFENLVNFIAGGAT